MHTVLAGWCLVWAIPEPLPPLSDLQRFPPLWLVQDQLCLVAAHQQWLQFRIDTEPACKGKLTAWLTESRQHAEPWVILEGIHQGHDEWQGFGVTLDETDRRRRLDELRRLIGWQAYQEGTMPPCVPLHRFRRGYDVPVLPVTPPPRMCRCRP
jgi:hypothetical protein